MDRSFLREKHAREVQANRVKLGIMVVALIALIGGMVRLAQRHAAEPQQKDGAPVSKKVTTGLPPLTGLAERAPAPKELTVGGEEGNVEAQFRFVLDDKCLEEISDQNNTFEARPFYRMLYRVCQDKPDELRAEARTDFDWQELWDKPASFRGQAVEVRGEIRHLWRLRLAPNPMGLHEVWGYRIRAEGAPQDSNGHIYDVYAIEKLYGALPYDKVTAHGRFLKAQIIEPPSERFLEDPDLHVAVVVASRFQALTYLSDPGIPPPVNDGGRPEARALYYLLHRAGKASFEGLKAQADRSVTYVGFMSHPERFRGEPVAIQGELRRCVRMPLDENILRLPDVFYGQIVDADRKMNTFYCLDVPDDIHLKDPVILYGYFLKNWTYVSEAGRLIDCPVIVAQRLVPVVYERDYTLEITLGGIVAVTVAALGVAYMRERSKQLALNEARRERQLARIPQNLNEVARRRAAEARGGGEPERSGG